MLLQSKRHGSIISQYFSARMTKKLMASPLQCMKGRRTYPLTFVEAIHQGKIL